MNSHSLREAAILIASLDTHSADALLDEMSSDQAALVRNAVLELGDITGHEQQRVIARFLGRPPQSPPADADAVEIDFSLAGQFERHQVAANARPPSPPTTSATAEPPPAEAASPAPVPFDFLDQVAAEDLAAILSNEHPQTTAMIVTHMKPARAADVLQHLPQSRQSEILIRIAHLAPPHPDVLQDLESEVQTLLAERRPSERPAAAGLATVEAILANAPDRDRDGLVAEMERQDEHLVSKLQLRAPEADLEQPNSTEQNAIEPPVLADMAAPRKPNSATQPDQSHTSPAPRAPMLGFPELEQFDDISLAQVMRSCNSYTTLLALAGASHAFAQRILSQLPHREARQLKRKIEQLGPLRLDDVHRAQQQLAARAEELIARGEIAPPRKDRLSGAA